MIQDRFGEVRTDSPDENIVNSMYKCTKETEGQFKTSRWNRLVEIYYYLFYGLYGRAWIKINDLRDDLRFKIPGDVYNFLKDICKNMNLKPR